MPIELTEPQALRFMNARYASHGRHVAMLNRDGTIAHPRVRGLNTWLASYTVRTREGWRRPLAKWWRAHPHRRRLGDDVDRDPVLRSQIEAELLGPGPLVGWYSQARVTPFILGQRRHWRGHEFELVEMHPHRLWQTTCVDCGKVIAFADKAHSEPRLEPHVRHRDCRRPELGLDPPRKLGQQY